MCRRVQAAVDGAGDCERRGRREAAARHIVAAVVDGAGGIEETLL
jgi:hypothetical protein